MTLKLFDIPEYEPKAWDELFMGNISRYVKKPSLYGKFGSIAEKKIKLKVPNDHILWGITSKNYDEGKLVTTPWIGQESFGMLILGMRGMGKSVLLRNILLDQIRSRFKHYVVAIDPKQVDFSKIHKRIQERKMIELLNKIGMQPQAYSVKRIIPKCLLFQGEDPPANVQQYMISIKNLRVLNPQSLLGDTLYMLSLIQASPTGEALQRVINMLNNPKLRPDNLRTRQVTTKTFFELIKSDILSQQNQRNESVEEGMDIRRRGQTSNALYFKFKERIEQSIIGDPTEKSGLKVDVVQELANNGVLVQLTNLDVDNERYTNLYVKTLLSEIIADVVSFRRRGLGRIDKPVVVAIDEADILAPNEQKRVSPVRRMILQLLTKYRYYGFSLFLVTQDPKMIWKYLVKQCKYILTPKIMNDDQAALIRERGVPEYQIEMLRKMYAGDEKPVQWALIEPDVDAEPKIFYPVAPCTEIPKESEVVGSAYQELKELEEEAIQ